MSSPEHKLDVIKNAQSNPSFKGDDDSSDISKSPLSESKFILKNEVKNYSSSSGSSNKDANPPAYEETVGIVKFIPGVSIPEPSECNVDQTKEYSELVHKVRKTMPLKVLTNEVRARRDLEKFLKNPVVVLDSHHTKLFLIVEELLQKLKTDLDIDEKITSQATKTFFTFQEDNLKSCISVDQLRETIQGVNYKLNETEFEQSWITAVCSLPSLKQSHVAIARLNEPVNFGTHCEEVKFVTVIIAPQKEKLTKNAVEIGRTFSSLLSDFDFRSKLQIASDVNEFKQVFVEYLESHNLESNKNSAVTEHEENTFKSYSWKQVGKGVFDDLKRRSKHYVSDFVDGVRGKNTLSKLTATVFFLYFACLLPDIAFGSLYEKSTEGKLNVYTCILSQTIGGIAFALFGGQPLLIMLTTAPLALYVKVVKMVSITFKLDFKAMYTMVGIYNAMFLILQALFNLSVLMKYSTRSTEEIFGFFIALAFTADAIRAAQADFKLNYHFSSMANETASNVSNMSCTDVGVCYRPENSLLYLVLMLGTLWLGITLYHFEKSPYLSARKREILADYALPISVVFFSFMGSYAFRDVKSEPFAYNPDQGFSWKVPDLSSLSFGAHMGAMGLGFCLSCLFFVDQNVSAAFVNAPQNKLKKGPAYHWDLVVVALINGFFSIFNLPWLHAALPHSPLHVRALADVEQHVTRVGTVHDEIVRVRETRLSALISHGLIGLSLLFVGFLQYIPVSVLQGLFLYLGISSFFGNQMFERLLLLVTEESSYPPSHYIRKVPQRKVHMFTLMQFFQLVVVSMFGFVDVFYLKMIFPVIIMLLLPIRHIILPKFVEKKYLDILDR